MLRRRVQRLEAKFAAGRALTHAVIIRIANEIEPRWQNRTGALLGTDAEPDTEGSREFERKVWDELRRRGYDLPAADDVGRVAT
jgi:hypothetical protein